MFFSCIKLRQHSVYKVLSFRAEDSTVQLISSWFYTTEINRNHTENNSSLSSQHAPQLSKVYSIGIYIIIMAPPHSIKNARGICFKEKFTQTRNSTFPLRKEAQVGWWFRDKWWKEGGGNWDFICYIAGMTVAACLLTSQLYMYVSLAHVTPQKHAKE